MAETAFIRDGSLVGSPLVGIDHYDLRRLSADQTLQLNEIMRKANGNLKLTPDDLRNVVKIRKTVACSAPPRDDLKLPPEYEKLGAAIAALQRVFR